MAGKNLEAISKMPNKVEVKPTHLTELKKEGDILKQVSDSTGRDNCQVKSCFDNRIFQEPLKNRFTFTLN
jgi:hypothetical protein